MTNSMNSISDKIAEERQRAAGQAQIAQLQTQIDDLRRAMNDQNQKYQLAIEQLRHSESQVSELQNQFVRQTQDIAQTVEGFRRDMGSLRKEVASSLVKIDDGIRPIRDMQNQIQELAEARKADRITVAGLINRLTEFDQKIGSLFALVKETEERSRAMVTRIETLQGTEDTRRTELRKILEEVQIEKQHLRRQAIENQQLVADSKLLVSEQQSRMLRIEDFRAQIDKVVNEMPEQMVALSNRITELLQESKKLERTSTERFLVNQQRIEEIRIQQDDKITSIQEMEDRHIRQITAWIERIDSHVRDLEQRLTKTSNRLENAQHEHVALVQDMEEREMELLATLSKTLSGMLDRIKAGQAAAAEADGKTR